MCVCICVLEREIFNLSESICTMGCVSSKESNDPPATPSWCPYLPFKTCTTSNRQADDNENDNSESRHVVSLTSSSYGVLNMDRSPCQGSFISFNKQLANKYQAIAAYEDFVFPPGLDARHIKACMRLQQVRSEENEQDSLLMQQTGTVDAMETINTWELMEGLEEEGCRTPLSLQGGRKLRLPNKPSSLESPHACDAALLSESGSPVWKKYYSQAEMVKESSAFCGILPRRPPSSPFNESPRRGRTLSCTSFVESPRQPPSCSSLIDQEDSRSLSSVEPIDGSSSGLKLLLSPVTSPSYYTHPLAKRSRFHAVSLSFDGNTEHLRKGSLEKFYKSPGLRKRCSRQQSADSSRGSDTPLFEESLLATFEQAVKATSECVLDDNWQQESTDEITTNSSSTDNTWPSSEMASDAESIPQWNKQEKQLSGRLISSVDEEVEIFSGPLTNYEVRCPPQGHGKVVLYHTSLRGVRKTYEDCCTLKLILKGIGVHVDERDVWMHAKYRDELLDVLGDVMKGAQLVPRLFIKGRYIGGAEEVKQLHEEGSLASLMEGIAVDRLQDVCDGCGDVRFVPCLKCSGSCKVCNLYGEVSRCLVCNENGLIKCPICTM